MKLIILFSILTYITLNNKNDIIYYDYMDEQIIDSVSRFESDYEEFESLNYYDGEYKEEIIKKINKNLKYKLKDKGDFIVTYSLEKGVDPYLVTGIIIHETGCSWGCSNLVKKCNNVAGNKGKPSCNGGSYRKFNSIEDGIKFSINVISSYYKNGYNTPKLMNKKYASDKKWHVKVEKYINKIKNS